MTDDRECDLRQRADAAEARLHTVVEALREALDEYEYACSYKGEYFVRKHGDKETLARLRAVLGEEPDQAALRLAEKAVKEQDR